MNKNFKNHIATIELENENFFILNWQDKFGSRYYQIRYILDKKEGDFFISGDVGSCVFRWYRKETPERIASYMDNIGYLLERCECSTDKYIRTDKQIEKDIAVLKEEIVTNLEEEYSGTELQEKLRELEEDFTSVESFLSWEVPKTGNFSFNDETSEILEKYLGSGWEETAYILGLTIHPRVFLWIEVSNSLLNNLEEFRLSRTNPAFLSNEKTRA